MRAGPKAAVDGSPLPLVASAVGSARFGEFCSQLVVIPKGSGALSAMTLRPWQLELVGSILDASPRPRTAGWMLPMQHESETADPFKTRYHVFDGWTLPELAILHRHPKRAA